MAIETLSEWLEAEGILPSEGPGSIADAGRVRALLIAAARRGEAVSYSQLLGELGHRFTRPKMRAVCKTLDAIDQRAAAAGEPELAVLVVRESDKLPGQGWWVERNDPKYKGAWEGPKAEKYIRGIQERAYAYWGKKRKTKSL